MSDKPKLDFEERHQAQQVYEECCENPEDFAYNYVALQSELAAAQTEIVRLRDAQIITVRSPDGGPCAAPCAIDGCQYERIEKLERLVHDLAGAAWRLDKRQCLRTDHLTDDDEAEAEYIIDVLRIAIDAARAKEGE